MHLKRVKKLSIILNYEPIIKCVATHVIVVPTTTWIRLHGIARYIGFCNGRTKRPISPLQSKEELVHAEVYERSHERSSL